MSQIPSFDPLDISVDPDAIETVIVPRARDLGGVEVRRAARWSGPSSSSIRSVRQSSCAAKASTSGRTPISGWRP